MEAMTLDSSRGVLGSGIVRHVPDGDQFESFELDGVDRCFLETLEYLLCLLFLDGRPRLIPKPYHIGIEDVSFSWLGIERNEFNLVGNSRNRLCGWLYKA